MDLIWHRARKDAKAEGGAQAAAGAPEPEGAGDRSGGHRGQTDPSPVDFDVPQDEQDPDIIMVTAHTDDALPRSSSIP